MQLTRSGAYRFRGSQQVFRTKPSAIRWDENAKSLAIFMSGVTDFNQPRVTYNYRGNIELCEIEQMLNALLKASDRSTNLQAELCDNETLQAVLARLLAATYPDNE